MGLKRALGVQFAIATFYPHEERKKRNVDNERAMAKLKFTMVVENVGTPNTGLNRFQIVERALQGSLCATRAYEA